MRHWVVSLLLSLSQQSWVFNYSSGSSIADPSVPGYPISVMSGADVEKAYAGFLPSKGAVKTAKPSGVMGKALRPHTGNGERHHPIEGGLHSQPVAPAEVADRSAALSLDVLQELLEAGTLAALAARQTGKADRMAGLHAIDALLDAKCWPSAWAVAANELLRITLDVGKFDYASSSS